MKDFQTVMSYKDFYNEPRPANPQVILKQVPTEILLNPLCNVNAILFHKKAKGQQEILSELFNQLDIKRKSLLNQYEEDKKNDNNGDGPVYFVQQSITWLIGNCFENFLPTSLNYQVNESEVQNSLFD